MSNHATGKGVLFIISGPAGSGKTTICDGLMGKESLQRIVTSTTRNPREGEIDGEDYHFLTPATLKQKSKKMRFMNTPQFITITMGLNEWLFLILY